MSAAPSLPYDRRSVQTRAPVFGNTHRGQKMIPIEPKFLPLVSKILLHLACSTSRKRTASSVLHPAGCVVVRCASPLPCSLSFPNAL